MQTDGLFVIICIVFIFAAWVATGGPTRPISSAGLFITPVTRPGEESQGYRLLAPANPIDTSSYPKQIAGGSATISSGKDLYARNAGTNASAYRSVYLERSTVGPASDNPNEEYVSIVNSGDSAVTITGWRLTSSATGESAVIPSGTELFHSGMVNVETRTALKPGDKAIVVTGRSPVGESFRENMCTGYLAQYQSFSPPLAQECPTASAEVETSYQGSDKYACTDSTTSIPRCAVVTSSHVTGACGTFLQNTLNYNACTALHQKETDFPLPTWHIFLNRSLELFAKGRETITLYDGTGKTVDSFSY